MKMRCVECKVKSEDGVLEHLESCSGYLSSPRIMTDYIRPPATEIVFESEKERKNFWKNAVGGTTSITPRKKSSK